MAYNDMPARRGRERTGIRGWPLRLWRALAGASLLGIAAAAIDAMHARDSVASGSPPAELALALFDVALISPIPIVLGLSFGLFGLAIEPDRAGELGANVLRRDRARRRRLTALTMCIPLGLVVWATATAQWARFCLTLPIAGRGAPFAAATGALLLAVFTAGVVLSAASLLERTLLGLGIGRDPRLAVVLGLAIAATVFGWGIVSGTTNGEGGWLGAWGVLRRPELDLRAPALGVLIVVGAYLGPLLLRWLPAWACLLLALGPLGLLPHAARGMGGDPASTGAIERGAPLGRWSLALLRRATDRDHDGASAMFGGGDCDDRNPAIGPLAVDVPGNGIDEDCSGSDAPLPEPRAGSRSPEATPGLFPKDLNVLLITVDTLRADLGYAGNPRPVSPRLDELAARSVVFDRAYSLASYTGKSVGPLMSGKYPSETHRGWGHFNKFPREDVMVAERLQKAGIHTVGVHAHWYFAAPFGLARGFDTWDKRAEPPGGGHDEDATITGGKLTDAALEVLGDPTHTSRRFFAWIHYLDPHSEYARHPGAPDFGSGQRALYDGEVWYTDQQIGRLLDLAAKEPWGQKTAIIVTSDHGEAFGEHHMIRHGFELWEELVRVPFIFYVPGAPPHHVSQRRSAIDLVPTLLDLFGVAPPDGSDPADFVSGRSLAEDLFLPKGYAPAPRDVFIDMPAGPFNDERRALIHEDWKLYVSQGVRYQLFDLGADPAERKDRGGDKELFASMRARYDAFRSGMKVVTVRPIPKEE